MTAKVQRLLDGLTVSRIIGRMAHQIAERNSADKNLVLVGIQRGGVELAQRLGAQLGEILRTEVPVGILDVAMHRDDVGRGPAPRIYPTHLPFDVTAKTVVLVDDVLFSGRTTRAALDALSDLGRPRCVQLAVLVDRGHRELPIKADFAGRILDTTLEQRIDVRWNTQEGESEIWIETA